jgi:type VI secretion system secreted protein VgrG
MDRTVTVTTPLPDGVLLIESMAGREDLGRPFTYQVDLLSKVPDIDPTQLLGQPMTVNVETSDGVRNFNGIVCRFDEVGATAEFTRYRAVLRPWLYLLTNTANCRIFQKGDAGKDPRTVPNIVKEVATDQEFKDIDLSRLDKKDYREWEFLVQYRESDFNFISRMLEQEGIYYYFTHTEDKHMLVLADASSSHDFVDGHETVPFFQSQDIVSMPELEDKEFLESFTLARQIEPGAYVTTDFNFENPTGDRLVRSSTPAEHAFGSFELFDFPGEFKERPEGEDVAMVRRQESQIDQEVFQGSGNLRHLGVGDLFKVKGHPRAKVNSSEFLITGATYTIVSNAHTSDGGSGGLTFHMTFSAIDTKRSFRPTSRTPKPSVQGPQTAIVVGPKDEEIWTDEYGRVKVQFHWDRYGASDENSSCFVRVSQVWAGQKWGAMHIPRIGQEVIVDFLEGDPDRPIVTGRVYNQDQPVPYDLPDNKTQSGIKSRSTPKGGPNNFNEIRFEDKKGSEELFIQAEKNKNVKVKHNRSASVGANDSVHVGGDRSVTVDGNLSVTVKGGGKSAIHSDYKVTGKHSLHASDTIEVDAPTHIKLICGDSSILIEPGKITLVAGGKAQIVLDANVLAQSKDGAQVVLDEHVLAKSKAESKVVLDDKATVQSKDGAQVVLDKNALVKAAGGANVTIDGTKIQVAGQSEATMSAGGSVKASAAGVDIAGAKINLNS